MKLKIEIKNRWTGNVLFEFEKENNSLKDTLQEAVRQKADLRGAYLSGADLRGAYLSDADLRGAYLSDADLRGADLSDAYLSDADLSDADLRGADLSGADLRGADLSGADLRGAYLSDADLRDAYLRGADLSGADLRGAYLSDVNNIPFIPMACPSDGAFIGWKKVGDCLIELEIPAEARRSSATTSKCRCDKAKVISITNGEESFMKVTNRKYGHDTIYRVGEMVYPDSFDDNRWNECSHGIHFFINKQEAIDYEV